MRISDDCNSANSPAACRGGRYSGSARVDRSFRARLADRRLHSGANRRRARDRFWRGQPIDRRWHLYRCRSFARGYQRKRGQTDAKSHWKIVGCGGWSKRKTLYGSDHWTGREDLLLDPQRDAAKIRAFFIHPDWARQGVGSKILQACEDAARAAGFNRYEMGATLTGAKLFGAKGYLPVKPISVPLNNGETLPVIHMEKQHMGKRP